MESVGGNPGSEEPASDIVCASFAQPSAPRSRIWVPPSSPALLLAVIYWPSPHQQDGKVPLLAGRVHESAGGCHPGNSPEHRGGTPVLGLTPGHEWDVAALIGEIPEVAQSTQGPWGTCMEPDATPPAGPGGHPTRELPRAVLSGP